MYSEYDLGKYMKDLSQNVTNDFIDEMAKQRDAILDDRKKTYDFWKTLRKANDDYLSIDVAGDGTFKEFMLYNYGIQLFYDENGNIAAHFEITDEHKHLLFVLKYS
jgi:hypothetical protein